MSLKELQIKVKKLTGNRGKSASKKHRKISSATIKTSQTDKEKYVLQDKWKTTALPAGYFRTLQNKKSD